MYYIGSSGSIPMDFLVNEGIDLILVIHTLYPYALSVLYNKDVCPISQSVMLGIQLVKINPG